MHLSNEILLNLQDVLLVLPGLVLERGDLLLNPLLVLELMLQTTVNFLANGVLHLFQQ